MSTRSAVTHLVGRALIALGMGVVLIAHVAWGLPIGQPDEALFAVLVLVLIEATIWGQIVLDLRERDAQVQQERTYFRGAPRHPLMIAARVANQLCDPLDDSWATAEWAVRREIGFLHGTDDEEYQSYLRACRGSSHCPKSYFDWLKDERPRQTLLITQKDLPGVGGSAEK